MRVLLGDTNGSGGVDLTDFAQTKNQNGQPVDASTCRFDANLSGDINLADAALVKPHGNAATCP